MASTITNNYCSSVTVTTENSTTTMSYDLHEVNKLNFVYGESYLVSIDNFQAIRELYEALKVVYDRITIGEGDIPPEEPES